MSQDNQWGQTPEEPSLYADQGGHPQQGQYPAQPGPPTQSGPYSQPGYYPPRPTNGLAIASLVCGIVGLFVPFVCLAAIILGHMGLSAVKRTGEGGRGYALAGAILGWVATVLGILSLVGLFMFGLPAQAGTASP